VDFAGGAGVFKSTFYGRVDSLSLLPTFTSSRRVIYHRDSCICIYSSGGTCDEGFTGSSLQFKVRYYINRAARLNVYVYRTYT